MASLDETLNVSFQLVAFSNAMSHILVVFASMLRALISKAVWRGNGGWGRSPPFWIWFRTSMGVIFRSVKSSLHLLELFLIEILHSALGTLLLLPFSHFILLGLFCPWESWSRKIVSNSSYPIYLLNRFSSFGQRPWLPYVVSQAKMKYSFNKCSEDDGRRTTP